MSIINTVLVRRCMLTGVILEIPAKVSKPRFCIAMSRLTIISMMHRFTEERFMYFL